MILGILIEIDTCVRASVLLISKEKISLPASIVKGTSLPKAWAHPIAMAVLPNEKPAMIRIEMGHKYA